MCVLNQLNIAYVNNHCFFDRLRSHVAGRLIIALTRKTHFKITSDHIMYVTIVPVWCTCESA